VSTRSRCEPFGGILALNRPAATVYVDQATMQELGYADSPLWTSDQTYLSAPVTTHFAVTHRCPLGCHTCYNSSGAARPGELSTAEAKTVLDTLAGMGVFTVAFGGGEPLAHPDIFELAQHARARGLTPTMTTNGYYVDEEIARRCRVFTHIHVSLDGVGDTYRAVRGVDGFAHADRAIRLLRRQRIPVGVNCVVSRANFDHLDEMARYLRRVGVRDVIFLRLKPAGRAAAHYQRARLTPEQARAFYPRFAELTRRYRLRSHVDCAMMPFLYCHGPDMERLRFTCGEGCNGANEIVEISPDGQVHACSFAVGSAGDARRLPEVWHTEPHLTRFRNWSAHAPDPCHSCRYLDLCHGGCHAVAQALTGDFSAPDPECPLTSGSMER
jgi:radical SAM protein with 4Fe4S-binding SPASM domain